MGVKVNSTKKHISSGLYDLSVGNRGELFFFNFRDLDEVICNVTKQDEHDGISENKEKASV